MNDSLRSLRTDIDRREFISKVGKGIGLAALTSATVAGLYQDVQAAAGRVEHLSPADAATDEDFWFSIQQAFNCTRSIVNLNNGGVSPSPRIVTEAFVRYTWEQEEFPPYIDVADLDPRVRPCCGQPALRLRSRGTGDCEECLRRTGGLPLWPGPEARR